MWELCDPAHDSHVIARRFVPQCRVPSEWDNFKSVRRQLRVDGADFAGTSTAAVAVAMATVRRTKLCRCEVNHETSPWHKIRTRGKEGRVGERCTCALHHSQEIQSGGVSFVVLIYRETNEHPGHLKGRWSQQPRTSATLESLVHCGPFKWEYALFLKTPLSKFVGTTADGKSFQTPSLVTDDST
ncbi:hypothetical protein EVAR_39976_1 [Eumeta japonica]|uniref:Uncharacterized protein n=1 Tax=Eumeta variegata TaxID=151549 RepID=A0A4C1YGY3_EUMVA|nr:hypothetical protein EVAR_39976_1 [Eumeta japonica]